MRRPESDVSLTAHERRALARIERVLQAREPRLQSLFATFTSLTSREAFPEREQLRPRAWRLRPITAAPLVMMLIVAIVMIGILSSTSQACGRGRSAAAPGQPAASSANGWDRACPSRTSYAP
jgi:Protein of unknown function (DUF3040)